MFQVINKGEVILKVAKKLFLENGYENTSINKIISEVGIAKGTFYLYFESKENLLEIITQDIFDGILDYGEKIYRDTTLCATEKLKRILSPENIINKEAVKFAENLHIPKNRELHEKINKQIVLNVPKLLVKIIEEGKKNGEFDYKLCQTELFETVQFITAGGQFLFDDGIFNWSQKERLSRKKIMKDILEHSIGAKKDSFYFLIH